MAHHFRQLVCFLGACALGASLVFAVEGDSSADNSSSDDMLLPAESSSVTLDDIYELLAPDEDALEPLEAAPLLDGSDFPFYGSAYITGTVDGAEATYFFPSSYRQGYYGLDSAGRLYNVSASSISGILYIGGTQYQVSSSSWTYPRYRLWDTTQTYQTLYFYPSGDTNVQLPGQPTPLLSASEAVPYIMLVLLGGVFLCCMRKS